MSTLAILVSPLLIIALGLYSSRRANSAVVIQPLLNQLGALLRAKLSLTVVAIEDTEEQKDDLYCQT